MDTAVKNEDRRRCQDRMLKLGSIDGLWLSKAEGATGACHRWRLRSRLRPEKIPAPDRGLALGPRAFNASDVPPLIELFTRPSSHLLFLKPSRALSCLLRLARKHLLHSIYLLPSVIFLRRAIAILVALIVFVFLKPPGQLSGSKIAEG